MRTVLAALLVILLGIQAAKAGAWTLDHGKVQVLTGVISSRASQRFDAHSNLSGRIVFNKQLAQTWMEYGLTDAVTLYCAPEYVLANTGTSGADLARFRSSSIESGARVLLFSRIGMLSVQLSGKSAGAFDMSVSASGEAGTQFEARILYGRNYKLFGRDAFIDIEAAERWIAPPRPNELAADVTAGVWVTRNNLVLLQSFNIVSGSGARPPYAFYRLHKLQASLLQRITQRWSVQGGYFFATAGQNIVREEGFIAQIWYRT